MKKKIVALLVILLFIPIAYLGSSHYRPDFVIRYTNADREALRGVEITFLDPFDSEPIGRSYAYVDFGTAENYRRYRNASRNENPPEFIVAPRPERPGEYFVKPRHPERLEILRNRTYICYARSFYGIVLDNVGTIYEYRNGSEKVIEALYNITSYAHSLGLSVVANIASIELIYNVSFLDGILREDVFFYEGHRVTDERDVEALLEALEVAKSRGQEVFVVEYVKSYSDFKFVLERLKDFKLFVIDSAYTYDHMPRRYKESKLELLLCSCYGIYS